MPIEFIEKPWSEEESLACLDEDIRRWFRNKFKTLTPPQRYSFKLLSEGRNVIITAPTGSGKTFSAFMVILSELFKLSKAKNLEDKVYCIYVSPLRALDNDIYKNLMIPLKEISEEMEEVSEIRIAIRTGDIRPYEKQRQLRKPPHILITTPESLAIILNSRKFIEKLRDVKWVVIDEIHELASSKRGVHLSLSLERLQESLIILSLLVGVGIATVLLYLVLDRRREKVSESFILIILSTMAWSVGYLIEMTTPSSSWKIIAAKSEYLGITILPVAWFIFSSRYTRRFQKITETRWVYVLFLIPFVTIFLAFTNEYHHFIWRDIQFFNVGTLKVIMPEYGFWIGIHATYSYVVLLVGNFLLIAESLKFSRIHRKKSLILILVAVLPITTSIVYVSKIYPFDLTPISFSFSMALLFICVYKLKLIDIVPLARDKIVENMDDVVMVFDNNQRLVDINKSAQRMLPVPKEELIGEKVENIFPSCPEISEMVCGNIRKRLYERYGRYFDVRVTPLEDERGTEIGRILIARDITDLKKYQSELERLNKNLEIEVKRRTEYIQKLLDQKNDFIKQLSHDLKTPLTPIISLLPLIRERVKDDDTKKLVDVVLRNANYIKNLVIETLELAFTSTTILSPSGFAENSILPPSGVYLIELDIRLVRTSFNLNLSASTKISLSILLIGCIFFCFIVISFSFMLSSTTSESFTFFISNLISGLLSLASLRVSITKFLI